MKLIIDIPEENYKKDNLIHFFGVYSVKLDEVIKNGIPLPKEHGRLIDADELLKQSYRIDDSATLSTRDVVNEEEIDDAPTIIEAESEE